MTPQLLTVRTRGTHCTTAVRRVGGDPMTSPSSTRCSEISKFWEKGDDTSIIKLDLPQTHSWAGHTSTTTSQPSEGTQAQQPHPPQSPPVQLLDSTPNRTDDSSVFVSVQSEHDKTRSTCDGRPSNIHDSPHHELQTSSRSFTKNGHLAVAAVNSLDSGISANGGYGTEEFS